MKIAHSTAFLSLMFLCSYAFGWGGTGHQVICLIAENHLTAEAKTGIKELIGDANISDAEVANWADEVRRQRRETSPWHYVNIPVDAATFDSARDGHDGDNVIDAILKQQKILADKSVSKEARTDALKFLVHFVGDIHQPLHCADRNGDKGGNARLVFFPGEKKAISLHAVWDTNILKGAMQKQRALDYAISLDKQVTEKQRKQLAAGTPEEWVNESHRIAVEKVYEGIAADGPPPPLDVVYIEKGERVVNEQLVRGGIRLAALLNDIFKK